MPDTYTDVCSVAVLAVVLLLLLTRRKREEPDRSNHLEDEDFSA